MIKKTKYIMFNVRIPEALALKVIAASRKQLGTPNITREIVTRLDSTFNVDAAGDELDVSDLCDRILELEAWKAAQEKK